MDHRYVGDTERRAAVSVLTREEILSKLGELKDTGTIREYVKQFAGLILDIRDMSEKAKV